MLNKEIYSLLIFTVLASVFLSGQAIAGERNKYPEFYNVVWESQSRDAAGSMPVGGGDIGLNVWVEDNELLLYVQRSGVHDEYNGFPKLGRVRIWTEPDIFQGATSFRQELVLSESCIEVSAKHPEYGDVNFRVWVEVHRPKVHIECRSGKPLTFRSRYESWRTGPRRLSMDENSKERWGWWDTGGWLHDVVLEPDHFRQGGDDFTYYHINPEEKLSSKMAYEIMGLGGYYGRYFDPLRDLVWGGWMGGPGLVFEDTCNGKYGNTGYKGWTYSSAKPVKKQEISMWFHTSRCASGEKWLVELDSILVSDAIPAEKAWEENLLWWKDFWDRSFMVLNPGKDQSDSIWSMGRNYNLFRYMTALNAYGENPTMFNGGLLSVDPGFITRRFPFHPDWRSWSGGNYTMQNQRWVYWPMLKWGDYAHMESQFNFFERVLDVAKLRVSKNYGIEGCLFEEVGTVYGLPMPMHYGFDTSYIERRQRPDWIEPGLSSNWCVIHHHTAMLEFSHMILEYYRYSGRDISRWLPIVKGTIDFFDNYYRMKAKFNANYMEYDPEGKLIIFPSGACESHYYVSNPVPDVAGLRAIVEGAMQLPRKWIDEIFEGREELSRMHSTLPGFHLDVIEGDTVMPPGRSVAYSWWKKTELYINYPMFPFNIIEMGDPEMDYVYNTYRHWDTWQTPKAWETHQSWANANVAFARMGITDNASEMTYKTLANGPYRFPSFWGPGYDWVPDHNWGGTGSVGLQEMLVQTLDDKIVLLPAWPGKWDCDFRIRAPQNTIVSGKIRKGKMEELEVTPEERVKDVLVQSDHRPNILLINIDDMGWRDVGFMGTEYYETPNIDALAAGGMIFTNAYASAANCAPSRACMMSGQWTPRHGIYTVNNSDRGESRDRKLIPTANIEYVPYDNILIPEILKAAGYTTCHAGKWHLSDDPLQNGFDVNIGGSHAGHPGSYYPPYKNVPSLTAPSGDYYLTDLVMDKTLEFLKSVEERPFFLYYSPYAVHTPIHPVNHLLPKYENKAGWNGQQNARYATMVENLDSQIGRMVELLKETGKYGNTFILFISDNGGVYEITKQWPLRAGKGSYYEGGIREPMFASWPGRISPGVRSDSPVTNLDFFPTILEVAGIPRPDDKLLDGQSILPVLTQVGTLEQRPLFWHFPIYLQKGNVETQDPLFRTRPGSAIRLGDWKLIHYFENDDIELYNLKEDIGEKHNLARVNPQKARELLGMLEQWRIETNAPVPDILNPGFKIESESPDI